MRPAVLLLFAAILAPFPAAGQQAPTEDFVYLCTPEGFTCVDALFLEHVTMWVVLGCATHTQITAFELGLRIDNQQNTTLSPTFPVPAMTDDPPPPVPGFYDLMATYSTPVPTGTDVVIVSFDVFYLDFEPLYFHIAASDPSSVGGLYPAYLAYPGLEIVPMVPHPSASGWDFAIDRACAVLATPVSWGAVKSLYR